MCEVSPDMLSTMSGLSAKRGQLTPSQGIPGVTTPDYALMDYRSSCEQRYIVQRCPRGMEIYSFFASIPLLIPTWSSYSENGPG